MLFKVSDESVRSPARLDAAKAPLVLALLMALVVVRDLDAQASPTIRLRGSLVDDLTGQPIVSALVELKGGSLTTPLIVQSETNGFIFDSIPPGAYSLHASKAGYFDLDINQTLALGGSDVTAGNTRMVAKRTVSGVVKWRDGKSVDGAVVQVSRVLGGSVAFRAFEAPLTRTDAKGQFRFGALLPGRYIVDAYVQGIASSTELPLAALPVFYPGNPRPDPAGSIDLWNTVESAPISITLDETTGTTLSGIVVPTEEFPQGTDVGVGLLIPGAPAQPFVMILTKVGTPFALPAVPKGTYGLLAFTNVVSGKPVRVVQEIVVTDRPISNIRILLPSPSYIEGQIEIAHADPDRKAAETAVPARGAQAVKQGDLAAARLSPIRVVANASKYPTMGTGAATSDTAGRFKIGPVIRADSYTIAFQSLPPDVYISSVTQGNNRVSSGHLTALASEDSGPIHVILEKNGATIGGVASHKGANVSHAFIVLAPRQRDAEQWFRTCTTLDDGTYSLQGIAPGEYDMFFFDRNEDDNYLNPAFLGQHTPVMRSIQVLAGGRYSYNLELP